MPQWQRRQVRQTNVADTAIFQDEMLQWQLRDALKIGVGQGCPATADRRSLTSAGGSTRVKSVSAPVTT